MRKPAIDIIKKISTFLTVGAMAFGLASGAHAAEADTVQLPSVYDSTVHFRAILHTHGVEFRWFRYANYKVFKSYEIIRTSNKPAGKIIGDGVIAGGTTNRYSTNFEEILDAGTYYYQLCSVTKTKRICSKTVTVKIVNKLPQEMVPNVLDSTDAPVRYKQAPAGQLELTVTREASGDAVLSWSPFLDSGSGFKWYKPVRSAAVDPYYPRDGYLAHLTDISHTAFIDGKAASGTVNYRICAVDGQDGLWCGNVVASTK